MAEERKDSLTRRGIIGAALVGAGGWAGWAIQRLRGRNGQEMPIDKVATKEKNPFEYDLSAYEKVDPDLLLFEPAGEFDPGFRRVKRIGVAPDGRLMVAGDKSLRFFDANGQQDREIELRHTPHCMHVSERDELFVGYARHFEIHDLDGTHRSSTERFGKDSFLTSIATHEDAVFVADAGQREVILCDREGTVAKRFGNPAETPEGMGFAIPSPYFDLRVDTHGTLWVVNPGRLRVEAYTTDGEFQRTWGAPGMKIEGFTGCCNPVFMTMTGDGRFITSEKGLARIKVHDPTGEFEGVVAGPSFLVDDKKLAKQACQDCTVGAGFDVAVDERGWVHALDPFRMTVRSFRPLA